MSTQFNEKPLKSKGKEFQKAFKYMTTTLAIHFDPTAIHAAVDSDGRLDLIALGGNQAGMPMAIHLFTQTQMTRLISKLAVQISTQSSQQAFIT